MPRPSLDADQMAQALRNYVAAREQAVRYVLSALDPTAFDAPARPYGEVLTRVQELITAEIGRYAEPPATDAALEQEEPAHG